MSPNLSFEHLAVILALAGCSKATPAADTSSTVRSDPSASAAPVQVEQQAATPPPATVTATALATPVTGGRGGPGGAASATDVLKKKDMHMANPTGQASCGAGSCTSEIKKK